MSIPIAYHPAMSVPGVGSFSPSAGKPALFHEALRRLYPGEIDGATIPVQPVTQEDLKLVHDGWYVDAVFSSEENNGFGNRDWRVPPACLWTVGSMVSASQHAIANPVAPVASLSSGFHHAGSDFGGGYCTFNGLMVAAALHLRDNPDGVVGILDCDFHYGDGTASILNRLPDLESRVVHHTSGRYFHGDGGGEDEALEFQAWLQESIDNLNSHGCSLVLYQAGADMHKDDPMGGLLNDAEMAQRDRAVFRGIEAPIVWNLAGGYRLESGVCTPVLQTHLNTYMEALLSVKHRSAFPSTRRIA